MTTTATGSEAVTLTVLSGQSLDEELDKAVARAVEQAMKDRKKGILVTRQNSHSFIIELTDKVPFGTTLEHDRIAHAAETTQAANPGARQEVRSKDDLGC